MRTPHVFSGKRENCTSWKIQTVEAVANAVEWGKGVKYQRWGSQARAVRADVTDRARGGRVR